MDNILKLHGQIVKPLRNCVIILDVCIALLAALLLAVGGLGDMPSTIGPTLAVWLVAIAFCHVQYIRVKKPPEFLQKLPPRILEAVGEECMTGMQFGNAILCKSGCLLVVNVAGIGSRRMDILFPRDMVWIHEDKFGRSRTISVTDRWQKTYLVMKTGIKLRGNGTFQRVDQETFIQALTAATPYAFHGDSPENRMLAGRDFGRMVKRVDEGYQDRNP